MSYNTALRERFTDGALNTASGPKVIAMAYDRLDRDLAGAIDALVAKDITKSHELLVHAQDIVHELHCMLDLDAWEHAAALASIYRYVMELLMKANVSKETAPAVEARRHLAELGDAFRQAASQAASQVTTPAVAADPEQRRGLSVRA